MADAEGLGTHTPKDCRTLILAYLGDTEGFRVSEKLQIYALELAKDGYFKRSAIAIAQPPKPDWDIRLEVQPPYVYLEQNKLVRWENTGKMLVSFQGQDTEHAVVDGLLFGHYRFG